MEQPTRFVGMDVQKDTIVMAVTATGEVGKATPYGTIRNTTAAVEKLVQAAAQGGHGDSEVLLRGRRMRLWRVSHADAAW
jgi:hypothetical protein